VRRIEPQYIWQEIESKGLLIEYQTFPTARLREAGASKPENLDQAVPTPGPFF
jgi:hypothetical protein